MEKVAKGGSAVLRHSENPVICRIRQPKQTYLLDILNKKAGREHGAPLKEPPLIYSKTFGKLAKDWRIPRLIGKEGLPLSDLSLEFE